MKCCLRCIKGVWWFPLNIFTYLIKRDILRESFIESCYMAIHTLLKDNVVCLTGWFSVTIFHFLLQKAFYYSNHYMLLTSCRIRGSSDRVRKQFTHEHARCSPCVHERLHVLCAGLSKWPHIPSPPCFCWQVSCTHFSHFCSLWVRWNTCTSRHCWLCFYSLWKHLWRVAQEA